MFHAWCLKLGSSQRELSQAIWIYIAYKLSFIVIGYKQDLCKFENYQFTKSFIKLGVSVFVCMCVSVFCEEMGSCNCFSLPIFTFSVKRQRKDEIIVLSVNSTWL